MATAMTIDVDGREIKLTSPDKVVFPELGITKEDLVCYVLTLGERVLVTLRDRPVTLERWPKGVHEGFTLKSPKNPTGEAFYQKSVPTGAPSWLTRATVTFPSGRQKEECVADSVASVVWMIQQGTLRFHPWPCRSYDTEHVDELRLDLDPQTGVGFDEARQVAVVAREVLAEAGLEGWIKTSGGRGLHIYCPVEPTGFIEARHAAIAVGRRIARRIPELATVAWWKEERGERVFVDFNQMARDRLMSSAYSIRPVPSATISMPLRWEDLPDVSPSDFTVRSVLDDDTLPAAAWADFASAPAQPLDACLEWYEADAAAGEGEMPYPPEYPKMPGEPSRVQPSRARSETE